jgi:hypothetical protein
MILQNHQGIVPFVVFQFGKIGVISSPTPKERNDTMITRIDPSPKSGNACGRCDNSDLGNRKRVDLPMILRKRPAHRALSGTMQNIPAPGAKHNPSSAPASPDPG